MALEILPCDSAVVLLQTELGATIVVRTPSISDKASAWKRQLANVFHLPVLLTATHDLFESHMSRGAFGGKQDRITPGISIARDGFDKVGTLCAVFRSENQLYGLTAAHILHSRDTILDQLHRQGEFVDKTKFSIMHPSQTDVLIEDHHLKEKYKKIQAMIKDGSLSKEEGENYAFEIQTLIHDNQAQEVGEHVFSYFGYGDHPNNDSTFGACRIDFALFTLNDPTATNSLPSSLLKIRRGKITGNIRDLTTDTPVYKIGRTTGQTFGTISGVGESANTQLLKFPTTEFLAIGESHFFGLWGDSGSGVWDESGNLVGMIWGSSPSTNTNYITSLPLILDWLRYHQNLELELKTNGLDKVWSGREEDYKPLGTDVVNKLKLMINSDNIDLFS